MNALAKPLMLEGESLTSSEGMMGLLRRALLFVNARYESILHKLAPDTHLHELGIGSVELLEVAAYIEDELKITIDDRCLAEVATLHELLELMRRTAAK